MRQYELVTVLRPDIGDEDVQAAIDRVHQAVTSRGGEVAEVDHWGRRKLAYPIKRYGEGNYVVNQIRLDGDKTRDLERALMLSEDVIRHLLVKIET